MNSITTTTQTPTLDFLRSSLDLSALQSEYNGQYPYPFIQIDSFLKEDLAKQVMHDFPKVESDGWIHYLHVNEKKHGLNKMDRLPNSIQGLIRQLNSPQFVAQLSKLTGIPGLLPDPDLEGGGPHQTKRDGYLNIHADFTVHPHKPNWRRRVNLLVYLNEGWEESYEGALELWTRDMKTCAQKIYPLFNRAVIFNTDEDSFHGVPEPLQCPETMTRKSIALYYFTEEDTKPLRRSTNYRARPTDGWKAIPIWLDKKVLEIYSAIKAKLGLSDDFASRILRFFNRK